MRISVVHTTIYRYDSAVHLEPHIFRLRPREDPSQRLIDYTIVIRPEPAGQAPSLDQDGNAVLEAWFDTATAQLSVCSSFQVETLRPNPFDFVLIAEGYDQPLRAALAPYLCAGSPVDEILPEAANPIDFLSLLNTRLYREFRPVVRNEGPPNPPDVTLRLREGSCRDLALLFCAACRARGIAARFVSGYEQAAASAEGHMHAWGEVYLPGGGWRGYDPSRGLAVSTGHVAVAAAADPILAAPVVGSFRGAARATMEFSISMQTV